MNVRVSIACALVILGGASLARAAAPIDAAKVVDLTWPIGPDTPYWPGGKYQPFKSEVIATLDADGVYSRSYCTPEHLGTHVDAPNHFDGSQIGLDRIPLEDLMAPAVMIDMTAMTAKLDADAMLTLDDVHAWEKTHGVVPSGSIVLLRTGWAGRIADQKAYRNMDDAGRLHFPSYSPEAATYLVKERSARALGVDDLSIDAGVSADFKVHHIVNGAGRYGLENLANLERLPATGAFLIVAPIKLAGGSGGQARVFAILP